MYAHGLPRLAHDWKRAFLQPFRNGVAFRLRSSALRLPGTVAAKEKIAQQAVPNFIDVSFFWLFFLASHFGVRKVLISNQ